MMPQYIYKPASTDRLNTNVQTDDPDLIVPLEANGVYMVRMSLFHAALPAVGFATTWRVPAGATGNRSAIGPSGTGTTREAVDNSGIAQVTTISGTSAATRVGVHGYATVAHYGGRPTAGNTCFSSEESVVFMGTTAGTLALQWAQSVADAVNFARLGSGSYMEVRRLA
jgi:hypothetical protein